MKPELYATIIEIVLLTLGIFFTCLGTSQITTRPSFGLMTIIFSAMLIACALILIKEEIIGRIQT